MEISFDPIKRSQTLAQRGLDFVDAPKLFSGQTYTVEDTRFDYPERRFQTYGLLDGRLVMLVWSEADEGRRIISMRKCNEREQAKFEAGLQRSLD
jgi:uncharacterized protein